MQGGYLKTGTVIIKKEEEMKWREAIWKRQAGCDNKGTARNKNGV